MPDAARDVWHDLRERRLWPLALLLVLAILAVPVLLSQSAAEPPAPDPAAAGAVEQRQATVVTLDEEATGSSATGSALDRFPEGDPFTPPGAIAKAGRGGTSTASAAASGTGTAGAPGGGGGTAPSDGGSGGSAPAPVPPPDVETETVSYRYVADVTLWAGERRRSIRGLDKLDMLPNEAAPALIFMGTTEAGGNAVFLVDATLRAVGEGRCVPSRANCVYVHLGPGSEHTFVDEAGESLRLRVEEIRRVEVRSRGERRRAAASSGAPARRFALPRLVDRVEVTETAVVPAAADGGHRSSDSDGGR
ncbi:MAG: hypothetical protein GXY03_06380 [Solirubrobacterales bacterium]|nr:hypothetical protein [Solirubrobacterales bacterium]